MKRIIAVGMTAMAAVCAEAKVATGVPFSDGMVLQRGRAVPVWGTAEPGESVTVSFAGCHPWLDVLAMVLFGLAVGILLTFLGGLMAVDRVPKCAAGAALGIAGIGSYLGAGLQSAFSGCLVARGADGVATLMGYTFASGYTLDYLAVFWIGVAALSVAFTIAAGRCGRNRCGGKG